MAPPPKYTPGPEMTKKMLAEGLKIVVTYIMEHHVYEFDGKIHRQAKGGPIGLDMTGELAAIFMSWWDKEFLKKLRSLGIEVLKYKRYVDDINNAFIAPESRLQYVKEEGRPGRLESMPDEQSMTEASDAHSMELLKDIGNDIHPCIQLEADYASRHTDNKLPMLDVKMWVERTQDSDSSWCKIMHEFYQKEVSSRAVVHARSSLPWSSKRTVLTQEVLRILLRCSPDLPWEVTRKHVETFVLRMQYSGYKQKFRAEVVKSALKAYRNIINLDSQGRQPLYRPKDWKRKERQEERRNKKVNWYKKGGNLSVIFVPATPTSELRKRYEKVVKETGLGIRVVEKSGRMMKSIVQRNNPFASRKCRDSDTCMVCSNGGGQCRRENVTYKINCSECDYVYHGETARNAYTRGNEHLSALNKNDKNSVLLRHTSVNHTDDVTPNFIMKVTSTHTSALERQLTEAVSIDQTPRDRLINNKAEYGHNKLVRVSLTAE